MEPPAGHTLLDWSTDRGHNSTAHASAVRCHMTSNTVSSHASSIDHQSPVSASPVSRRLRRSPSSSGAVRFLQLYLTSYHTGVFHYQTLPNFVLWIETVLHFFFIAKFYQLSNSIKIFRENQSNFKHFTGFFCKILNANSLIKQLFYYTL